MSISQDRLRHLLTYEKETGTFTWNIKSRNGLLKSGTIAGGKDAYGYRKIHLDGVTYKAHRLAWMYEYGVWPCGMIDHYALALHPLRAKALPNFGRCGNPQQVAHPPLPSCHAQGFAHLAWAFLFHPSPHHAGFFLPIALSH